MALEPSEVILKFSTAITALGNVAGEFHETTHKQRVESFTGDIAQLDGFEKAKVDRYQMAVTYWSWITDPDAICAYVQQVIDGLPKDPDGGLFPLRGNKRVTVTIVKPQAAQSTTLRTLCVTLQTDLYPLASEADMNAVKRYVGDIVGGFDGARGYGIYRRRVHVVFDSAVVDNDVAFAHVAKALNKLRGQECASGMLAMVAFFPYQGKHELKLTHTFKDGVHTD